MQTLSGTDFIQSLQELHLNEKCLPSKFYTDFEQRMIWRVDHKWLLEKRSKVVAAPAGCKIQNSLV